MTSTTLANSLGLRFGYSHYRSLTEEEMKLSSEEKKARPPKPGLSPTLEFETKSRARCTICGKPANGYVIKYFSDRWRNYVKYKRQHVLCFLLESSEGVLLKKQAFLRRKEFTAAFEAARRKKLVEVI
jgi:hypothetical protein